MQEYWIAKMEQPRGPVFGADVRANYQLSRRMVHRLPINLDEIDGQLARKLSERLGAQGVPTDRTIRRWVQGMPDYPERMLGLGVISYGDILPEFRPYLRSGNLKASMGQTQQLKVAREEGSGSGLSGFLATMALAGAAILLANQIRRPRPGPAPLPHLPATNRTMKRLRPVSGSIRSYRDIPSNS